MKQHYRNLVAHSAFRQLKEDRPKHAICPHQTDYCQGRRYSGGRGCLSFQRWGAQPPIYYKIAYYNMPVEPCTGTWNSPHCLRLASSCLILWANISIFLTSDVSDYWSSSDEKTDHFKLMVYGKAYKNS